ncbi:Glucose-6-phosphate isomerase [compost metagenome]
MFVQGIIWGINSFDQWGVELGKALGLDLYEYLVGKVKAEKEDCSTQGLIEFFRTHHRG